ncbi:hypothetical protein ACE1N8_00125 [Streptomyces sp. DSM 116494]|uniref:hypothetical protein n=1 Tax=Streptomyces okerensis TaxID=3344655 RepID=UPI00389009DA
MSSITDDIASMSAWVAKALESSGYRADFSIESLNDIDRFIDDNSVNGVANPGGILAEGLGKKLFALGAYVGETLRHRHGGTWQADDSDPAGEINATLVLPDGGHIWPIQRVINRFKRGDEESIAVYGLMVGN